MAVHKCCTFRLKRKNLLSPTLDACCLLLALRSIQLMTGELRPRCSALQLLGESGACEQTPPELVLIPEVGYLAQHVNDATFPAIRPGPHAPQCD